MHRRQRNLSKLIIGLAESVVFLARQVLTGSQRFYSRLLYAGLLTLILLSGVLFYVLHRSEQLPWLLKLLSLPPELYRLIPSALSAPLPQGIQSGFPSFVSGVSVVLFAAILYEAGTVQRHRALTLSLITLLLFEGVLGYADPVDVIALFMGASGGLIVCHVLELLFHQIGRNCVQMRTTSDARLAPERAERESVKHRWLPIWVVIPFSSMLAMGTSVDHGYSGSECARYSEEGYCEEYKRSALPVYMDYATLRNSVGIEGARSPDRIGRLYLYGDYVFLNEVNEGIHVIDNVDPTNPVNLGFIRIPGNTDIAIRDNYLYADSYVDLITIDVHDPMQASVVARQQDIFPYDAYQNVPQNITFNEVETDRDIGVVVSYRLRGS